MAAFLIFAVMLLSAPLTSAEENDLSADDSPVISAAEIDYPPFSFINKDGSPDGFSVELMRRALSAMGRDVTFRTGPWSEVRRWLEKGEVQALPLVGRTPERESVFDFTFPYMSLHGAIVVRNSVTDIRNLEDLRGRRVAVMQGDNAEEFLRRQDFSIDIKTTPTFEDALRELSEGSHDAVVIQRLVALRLIKNSNLRNLKVINKPLEGFRQDFCFAVKEGDKDTLALLNEGLSLVMADGNYRHLHAKWFAAMQLPAHRKILIGGDHNYPPFEYLDENGNPAGFNVAITRAIARELGLDIEVRLGPWSKIIKELEEGRIDVIQGMLYSPQRDLTFDFTQPYTVNHYISVVRKGGGPPPDSVEMLRGRKLVVQKGDIMHDFALKNGLEDHVSVVDSQEEALRQLSQGKYDCALAARLTALYWIEKNGWDNLAIARQSLLSPGYGFAVPHNQKALLAQFGEGLKILEKSGELQQIREKHLGVYEDLPPDFSEVLRYTAVIVVPLLLLLSAFLLWSWSLRKQVASRTKELKRSENQYRLLADNTLDVIWTMSPDAVFTYVNPAIRELTGHTPEEWIGSHLSEHCDEAEFKRLSGIIAREIDKGSDHQSVVFETEILHKEGSRINVEIHGRVLFDENLEPVMVQGVTRDITERKMAEAELKESEKRFRLLVESAPEAIFIQTEGCFAYLNSAAVNLFGAGSPEDLLGKPVMERFHPDYHEVVKQRIRLLNREKKAVEHLEEIYLKMDGTPVDVLVSAVPFNYRGKDGALVFVRDITEQKKAGQKQKALETQLQMSQRMEAVGRLAGGVAHDFNNLLSIILGYGEMLLENMEKHNASYEPLTQICDAGIRARNLTRQLLAFGRKQVLEMERVDINEVISSLS
ncbi:MAG: transporter substrate-binding domain-containing protein, partial [Desulfobacterales bacterium]|nr:transporter substrate-binding domain-containing protein [Desulfobacterales bacterium]